MKIFVAGSGGQLAGEVIKAARAGGCEVLAPEERAFDITDFSQVSKVISEAGPDVVINCAAYNDVDGAETDWQDAFLANGIGVRNLALACDKYNSTLVHFSSDYVFGGGARPPATAKIGNAVSRPDKGGSAEERRPYTIADRPEPVNRYGESKLLGEEFLRSHSARYFLIRTSWLFGEGKHSFPKKVLEWASKNKTLGIVDDQVSSPTYTRDLAGAVMKLISTENYGLYHMTNSGFCSRFEWAAFILQGMNWQGSLEPAKSAEFNTPAIRPEFSVLDNFPLLQTLGSLLPTWQDATERFLRAESRAL